MSIRRVGFLKNEIVFNLLDKILSLSVTKVFNNSCNFFFIVILNLILSKSYDISIDLWRVVRICIMIWRGETNRPRVIDTCYYALVLLKLSQKTIHSYFW